MNYTCEWPIRMTAGYRQSSGLYILPQASWTSALATFASNTKWTRRDKKLSKVNPWWTMQGTLVTSVNKNTRKEKNTLSFYIG